MGKDRGRREAEERARRQEQEARDLQNRTIQAIELSNKPTPLQERLEKDSLAFLDWETTAGRDVGQAPGMSPYLGLYDAAVADQEDERQGQGLIQMGANGSNPDLFNLIKQNRADRRKQGAAGALERAFALRRSEARGSALPLIGLTQQRQMGAAGMFGNLAAGARGSSDGAWDRYFQIRQQPGFLESMFRYGMGNLQDAGRASAGGGF